MSTYCLRITYVAVAAIGFLARPALAQPNVLIFVADDVSWHDVGPMGNNAITTPNLDALAARGVTCTNMFLTTASCSPSRISILTGKYPHATGAEDLHMPLPEGERLLPSYLKDAGYFTGHMRKTHYGPNGNAQFNWYDRNVDGFTEFLDAAGDNPFFMWVGFRDAHRPYEPGSFDPPHDPANVKVPPYLIDDERTRADLALYYDEIARMDKNIGAFLAELRSRNLTDNTIVIFFGDNGMPFPRAKATCYDSGIGTPFIVAWPGEMPAGRKHTGLAGVIDLAPTILDAAGIDPQETAPHMHGRSVLARWKDPALPGHDAVFSERNWHNCDEHIRAVRTARYKLIRNAYLDQPHGSPSDLGASPSFASLLERKAANELTRAQTMLFDVPRPRIELYDLESDPWETTNLAGEPGMQSIVAELEGRLDQWRAQTGDFPETVRRRPDNTDRYTGVKFANGIGPMTHLPEAWQPR